ncbi:MAG TPA: outer membrane protein assembly factor BamA [bacterium]|nr:outer membrane protein assembly factor BamA [bacterium]
MKKLGSRLCAFALAWLFFSQAVPLRAQSAPGNTPLPPVPAAPAPESQPQEPNPIMGTVRSVKFAGLNFYSEDVARDIVGLDPGEVLTREKLENAINNLRKWGIFVKVEALVEYDDNSIDLTFEVPEGYIIKDVKLKGNYPLLETRVRRTLFLIPGQIYDKDKLPEQLDRLDRIYEQEGYFDTTVLAIEDYDEVNREVTIELKIEKGKTYRLRKTDVEGNTALDERRIKTIIFTYSHYKPRQIKKDLDKIQNLYRKKGFVRARVRLEGETYDYENRKVDVEVKVRQGKRVFVVFEGNDHYFDKELRKAITIYEDGDFDDFEVEISRGKLVKFYQERGYAEVKVEAERKKLDDENYRVTFRIIEGPQRRIKAIAFQGNNEVEADKLRELMRTKENSVGDKGVYLGPLFQEDLKLITDYYNKEGWLDAKVLGWNRGFNAVGDKMILTIDLEEGARSKVKDLTIDGMPEKLKADVWPKLISRPGEPYSPSRLDEDAQYMLIVLSNNGYPYAKIDKDVKRLEGAAWDVKLNVDPGVHVTIGRVLFVGNALTKEKTLRRNMRFKEGSEFSTEKILQSQLNIRRLGAFDAVGIETLGLADRNPVVHTVVRLQEKKSKIIDFEAGYNTDFGFSGKVVFNKLNMWGSGKNGNIKLQAGQEISRFEINYVDPRLFGTSLQLLIGTYAGFNRLPFYENFETGAFSTLFKDLGPFLSAYGGLNFEFVDFNESKTIISELEPRESADDNTRLATTLGVTYDRRDSYGDPRRGYYLNGSVTATNQFIQIGGNYVTARSNFGIWWSPFTKITFANALRVNKIWPLPGDTFIPADNRLYLGGDDTVRGFDQDSLLPTGGTFSMVHNFEMQMRVFGNFQVVGFVDSGVVVNNMSDINLSNWRHSAGPGVRYVTPVGPVRVDVGFILDPEPGDDWGRVHFTFGYFF